jgi:hypothetical protein
VHKQQATSSLRGAASSYMEMGSFGTRQDGVIGGVTSGECGGKKLVGAARDLQTRSG